MLEFDSAFLTIGVEVDFSIEEYNLITGRDDLTIAERIPVCDNDLGHDLPPVSIHSRCG